MPSWFLIEDNVVKDHTSIIMPFYSVYETAMNGTCIYAILYADNSGIFAITTHFTQYVYRIYIVSAF
jgi:hypothetical protein